jgi:hypothetical protein
MLPMLGQPCVTKQNSGDLLVLVICGQDSRPRHLCGYLAQFLDNLSGIT